MKHLISQVRQINFNFFVIVKIDFYSIKSHSLLGLAYHKFICFVPKVLTYFLESFKSFSFWLYCMLNATSTSVIVTQNPFSNEI